MMPKSLSAVAVLISSFWGAPAFAHVHLVSSNPADKASVSSPTEINLRFNGPLVSRASAVRITDARGGELPATVVPGAQSSEMVAKPEKPLAPGVYRVTWTAAGEDDGHKMSGNLSFTVK